MDSQIQELQQHPQQIFHCKKDKQPSLYLCLDLCCKQPRFACSKCQDLHVSHSNYLFPIEEVTKPDFQQSKIADYFEDAHILIKSQSEGMRTAHRLLSKLNEVKEQLLHNIEQIKCELLETMDIKEYELNTNRIAEAFITPRQDSQEQVEYLLKQVDKTRQRLSKGVVQLRQSDTKGLFERQIKKVFLEYENTIKQMSEILGGKCTSVDKEKQINLQIQQNLKRILDSERKAGDTINNLFKQEESQKEQRNRVDNQGYFSNNKMKGVDNQGYFSNTFDDKPHLVLQKPKDINHNRKEEEEDDDHRNENQITSEKKWEQQQEKNSQKKSEFQNISSKQSNSLFEHQNSDGKPKETNVILIKTEDESEKQQNNNEFIQMPKEKGKDFNFESKDENGLNNRLDIQNKSKLESFMATQNQSSSSFISKKPLGSGSVSDEVDKIIEGDLINKQIMDPLLSLNPEFSSAAKLIQKQQQYSIEFSASKGSNNSPLGVGIAIKNRVSGKIIKECAIFVGKVLKEQAEYVGCIFGLYMAAKLGISNAVLMSESASVVNLLSGTSKMKDYQILANKLKGLFEIFENKLISASANIYASQLAEQGLEVQFV